MTTLAYQALNISPPEHLAITVAEFIRQCNIALVAMLMFCLTMRKLDRQIFLLCHSKCVHRIDLLTKFGLTRIRPALIYKPPRATPVNGYHNIHTLMRQTNL